MIKKRKMTKKERRDYRQQVEVKLAPAVAGIQVVHADIMKEAKRRVTR